MNNQIANPKVEVPTGISCNDKDYINSLLSCLKEMSKNYVMAMNEASNESLYEKYKEVFLVLTSLQREVYELMFRKGWYSLENVDTQKISQKSQMLSQEYQDLNGDVYLFTTEGCVSNIEAVQNIYAVFPEPDFAPFGAAVIIRRRPQSSPFGHGAQAAVGYFAAGAHLF